MYTAAEALRMLKSKIVNKEHHTNCSYCNECLYREENIMKMIDDQIFEIEPPIRLITKNELIDFIGRCECIDEMPEDFKLGYDTACRYISYYLETIDFKPEPSNPWGKGRCCVEDAPSEEDSYLRYCKSADYFYIDNYLFEDDDDPLKESYWLREAKKGDLWWPLPEVSTWQKLPDMVREKKVTLGEVDK